MVLIDKSKINYIYQPSIAIASRLLESTDLIIIRKVSSTEHIILSGRTHFAISILLAYRVY